MKPTDEDVCPYGELLELAKRVCSYFGDEPPILVIKPRKGRSERVTLTFPDKSRVSITHRSRVAGSARLAMRKLLHGMLEDAERAAG